MKRGSKILALLVAFSLAGAPVAALAASTGSGAGARGASTWSRVLLDRVAAFVPVSLLRLIDGTQEISAGNDGRLTFLLLGSDARAEGVARTDTIMVTSLRGNSVSILSIPRDAARIPNPDGGTFPGRINAILKQLRQGRTADEALAKFVQVIEYLLQIEIDHYALLKFDGFQRLVEEIEPVSVDINGQIADARFWDDPNQPSGVYFPPASNYELYGWQPGPNPLCNGLWRFQATPIPSNYWCRRAMPFVRSRKSASDFVRARRQQDFVIASVRRVINRGTGSALGSLASRAQYQATLDNLETDLPINASTALDLYQNLSGAGVGLQTVLSPPRYATHIPGGTAYELNLAEVRQLTRDWFGGSDNPPVPPATTLPTAPPAGATTAPTTGPAPAPSPGASGAPTFTPGPGPTVPPGQPTPLPSAVTSQPTPALAVVVTPQPGGGSTAAEQPQPTPLGGGSAVWWVILAAALVGAAALGLLWRRTRQSRGSRH